MGYAVGSKQKGIMTFPLDIKRDRKDVLHAKYSSHGVKPIVHAVTIS